MYAKQEMSIRLNFSVFTIPKGYQIYVAAFGDTKALVYFGKECDWFDKAFLQNFEALNEHLKPQPAMGRVNQYWVIPESKLGNGGCFLRPSECTEHVISAQPTFQLIDKLELALEQYANPEWPDTAAMLALTELRKWKDGLK